MTPLSPAVEPLTELFLPAMRRRIDKLGIEASGAYNFYRSRVVANQAFSSYEVLLAQKIVDQFATSVQEVHEIGCGWGQLVFLMASCGYKSIGFEVDSKRFEGAQSLSKALERVDEACARRASIRNESFPPLDRPESGSSLVVSTNVVVSDPHLFEPQMVWALRRYKYAIIDVDRFCRLRRASERQDLIDMIGHAGLKSAGLFCDAGNDGQFYLFELPDHASEER